MKQPSQAIRPRQRALALTLACGALGACGEHYPKDWASVEHPWFAQCPDLSGSYRIGARESDTQGVFPLSDSPFSKYLEPSRTGSGWRWETMTIKGDASTQLEVTLVGADHSAGKRRGDSGAQSNPAEQQRNRMLSAENRWSPGFRTMSDADYAANLGKLFLVQPQQYTLVNGSDYHCSDGWLVCERLVHDPGPDPNTPRPDYVSGEVRFAKDKAGFLVALSEYSEEQRFDVWCGDGCKGFPLGTWTVHKWRHWSPETESAAETVPAAWAGPFESTTLVAIDTDRYASPQLEQARSLLAPLLPDNLRIAKLDAAGAGVRATLVAPDSAALVRMFAAIDRGDSFADSGAQRLQTLPSGELEMWLWLQLKPIVSDTPPAAAAEQLQALIPAGVELVSVKPGGGGFRIVIRSSNNAEVSQVLRNIESSTEFRSPELESITSIAGNRRESIIQFRQQAK